MPSFEHSLPMILHRTLHAVMPPFREIFARHDLTDQQWRILRALWDSERMNLAELAAMTLLPAPSLVGIIDRLEKRGLVARIRSVEDRRHVFIVPTEAGRTLYREVEPLIRAIHADLAARVSSEDWATMERILTAISTGPKVSAEQGEATC